MVKLSLEYAKVREVTMVHKNIIIDVADGIRLHEAANIAREMENMDCSCELIYGDKRLNAKSQISIISAGIKKGSEVTFECDGDDEEKALAKLVEMASEGFKK